MRMKTTNISLTEKQMTWLREKSETTGASQSWHIRRLINAEMKKEEEKKDG